MSSKQDTKPKPNFTQDELFSAAMRQFQEGQWNDGLEKLTQLMNRYPGDKELSVLHKEMLVRSRIDTYEEEEDRKMITRAIIKYATIAVLVVVLGLGIYWAVDRYSGYVQNQVETRLAQLEENAKQLEIYARFRDAQNLLLADRPNDALVKFEEIKVIEPEYPNLSLYIDQAKAMALIEDEYNRAVALLDENKQAEALEILTRINQTIPNYRDVTLRIEQLNANSSLEVLLRTADSAFQLGDWETALVDYSKLRSEDSTYQTAFVERRLYESYLNAAQAILNLPEATLDQLRTADSYYIKASVIFPRDDETVEVRNRLRKSLDQSLYTAYVNEANLRLASSNGSLLEVSAANALLASALDLRPDNTELLAMFETNKLYLQAVDDYLRGEWDLAILSLDTIVKEDETFASGAAAQALYDALVERGRNSVLQSDFETALGDFDKALDTADDMENNTLARVMVRSDIAQSLGLLTRTSEAVQVYQSIVLEADLLSLAAKNNEDLYQQLVNAQAFADVGDYGTAFGGYRDAMDNLVSVLNTQTYVVQDGDFLPWLARQNGTTTDLIMQASTLLNRRIENGDSLIIPVLSAGKP